jgi:hypothetical protein
MERSAPLGSARSATTPSSTRSIKWLVGLLNSADSEHGIPAAWSTSEVACTQTSRPAPCAGLVRICTRCTLARISGKAERTQTF